MGAESWREELRGRLGALGGRRLRTRPGERHAAVLVPILDGDKGRWLLLEKRSTRLPHHAGQYAFPGGGIEASDDSALDAALREAEEEVGLAPSDVDVLGFLPDLRTPTGFVITPVVGAVEGDPELRPSPAEVEYLIRVPLLFLLQPGAFQTVTQRALGLLIHGDALVWEGHVIWGATARILLALRRALRGAEGDEATRQ